MAGDCCGSLGYDEVFNARSARRELRRFRRRGLGMRARRLVRAIAAATPLRGATALEIGAGIGAVTVSLLEQGTETAETVDAVPAFVAATRENAAHRGLTDRLTARAGDFAADPGEYAAADVVVLDRVICCYPELHRLLPAAAQHARHTIALTYPRDRWWVRRLVQVLNGAQRLLRRRFRMYFHSPDVVRRLLVEAGFTPRVAGHAGLWEILVAARPPHPPA
jgi:2-polyprenyl-3-methyl-5-hydroxy-6-metoxy-1,4-benzoquinol methylase